MYGDHRITVVIPAYNEEGTIGSVVDDYNEDPWVDEVLVVDNNCTDGTADLARSRGAKVVEEKAPGYGHALRCGMDHAQGDILFLTEGDGSFSALDIPKFLAYIDQADLIMGTRTTKQLITPGARMDLPIRLANTVVGKMLELCWFISNETPLTDVGCTYRAIWKDSYRKIRSELGDAGPEFSPEMVAVALRRRLKIIEIPVRYGLRAAGESKHSGNYYHLAHTALKMIRTILRVRSGIGSV